MTKQHYRLLLALWLLAISSLVQAQTVRIGLFGAVGDADFEVKPEIVLSDLKGEEIRLELRLAGGLGTPVEMGLGFRANTSLGPVGNLLISGRADLDTSGNFAVHLSGEGVLASVGLRAGLRVFNSNAALFYPQQASAANAAPLYAIVQKPGFVGLELELGLSYRLSRTIVLELDPSLNYVSAQGLGGHLDAALELRHIVERDDAAALLMAHLAPGGAGYGAAGFEYRLNRRDLPLLRGSLWLGAGSSGVTPGLRLSISDTQDSTPLRYRLELALEPYRMDAFPYRGTIRLATDLGNGELAFMALAALGEAPTPRLEPFTLKLSYGWSF